MQMERKGKRIQEEGEKEIQAYLEGFQEEQQQQQQAALQEEGEEEVLKKKKAQNETMEFRRLICLCSSLSEPHRFLCLEEWTNQARKQRLCIQCRNLQLVTTPEIPHRTIHPLLHERIVPLLHDCFRRQLVLLQIRRSVKP